MYMLGLSGVHPDLEFWQSLPVEKAILYCAPFALMLLSIATLPLALPHFWEKNKNKAIVSLSLGAVAIAMFVSASSNIERIVHTALEYMAFIALLASLYIISGGIYISGAFAGLPYINTTFLGVGALLANLMGTTGASMLLIRPLLRANRLRRHKKHIVIFFIFIVSNCSGLLTPLADPPLFLGFLRGVPFDWTFKLFPQWAVMLVALLFVFHIIDEYFFDKEDVETKGSLVEDIVRAAKRIEISGRINLLLLLGIIGVILLSGYLVYPRYGDAASKIFQTLFMGALAGISMALTPGQIRRRNEFGFGPIVEVAVVFAGIFAAMIPALAILEAKGSAIGVKEPWQFFWLVGMLSSFLDNAPTYLTYATLASSIVNTNPEQLSELARRSPELLAAISCGAVFMGANTYIGNGPNFMVRAIAEEQKIRMPSFFGYMLWSVGILVPLFVIVTIIFF